MSGIDVRPLEGRRDLRRFLRLPWRIYASDPAWVPPLLVEQRKLLDRERHPFHQHAQVEYFLARRDGEVVGRVAAIVNHRHNEFHGDRVGFFGFFEAVRDEAVAHALLGAVERWLRARGMESARGPMSFSTNEECGLLVAGFGTPPFILMTHNPPYSEPLLRAAGYAGVKDLLAYMMYEQGVPARLARVRERLERRLGVAFRTLDMKRLGREVEIIQGIYNTAWERNWGFVPMTPAEFDGMAKDLKRIVDPRMCFIAEHDGEPVAFSLALPDLNQALARIDGRLLPFGVFKLLWHARRIDQARVLTLGVVPGYRKRGLDGLLIARTFAAAAEHGYRRGECSWILEDNLDMRRALESAGGRVYKTYRIYEKPL
ncbi:MAG TPA: hypothetical protein VMK65_07255 [Longimicrobiales bacterium]|nr:hypothetical protein [Longimicrobiales bacterium]